MLTPAELVEALRAGMATGEVPPLGEATPIDDALPMLAAGIEPVADPDLVCLMVGAPSVSATYEGLDGLQQAWRDWGEAFSELSVVFEDVRAVPAGALVLVRQIAVTQHGAMPIEQPSAMLLRLRDGHVTAVEFHLDRDMAERAGSQAE